MVSKPLFIFKFRLLSSFLCLLFFFCTDALAEDFVTAKKKIDYFRIEIGMNKDSIKVERKNNYVHVLFFGQKLPLQKKEELINDVNVHGHEYVKKVEFKRNQEGFERMELLLAGDFIEMFEFFKKDTKRHVLDFWIDQKLLAQKSKVLKNNLPAKETQNKSVTDNELKSKDTANSKVSDLKAKTKKTDSNKEKKSDEVNEALSASKVKAAETLKSENSKTNPVNKFRDFRYGASFIWDYQPEIPKIKSIIDLKTKTPDYFFPIIPIAKPVNDQESHYNLIVNFYRKRKFGYMNKSIKIFEKKYGKTQNDEVFKFIIGNSLIYKYFKDGDKSVRKAGVSVLLNTYDLAENYEIKQAISRYLIQYHLNRKDYLKSLEYSKKLFIDAHSNLDDKNVYYSSTVILYSLAQLSQVEKIDSFLNEELVKKSFDTQEGLAFKFYSMLTRGEEDKIIEIYQNILKTIRGVPHSAVLFNVAESFFRVGKIKESIKVFDRYLKSYSYEDRASEARLRIALGYDLLSDNPKKIKTLYQQAIDLGSNSKLRYEAKLRLVGFNYLREYQSFDNETLETLLKFDLDEEKSLDKPLKELLWLVRLRSFIIKRDYDAALAYYDSIPLESMTKIKRRTFDLDFKEIVFGNVKRYFTASNFPKVIKIWSDYNEEKQKDLKFDQVFLYYVSKSFLELGLDERAKAIYDQIDTGYQKNFPLWTKRPKQVNIKERLNIDQLVKQRNWKAVDEYVEGLSDETKIDPHILMNWALASSGLKNHKKVSEILEVVFNKFDINDLNLGFEKDIVLIFLRSMKKVEPNEEKFQAKAKVFLDLDENISGNKERLIQVAMLLLDSYAKEKIKNFVDIDKTVQKLRSWTTQESVERLRGDYIYGLALSATGDEKKAKEIFENLSKIESGPNEIKELARIELKNISINESI